MWSGRGTFSVTRISRSVDLGRGACADHDDCDQKRDQTAHELHRIPPLGWLTCSSRCVTCIETGVGSGTSRSTPGPSPAEPRCGRASWRMTGRGPKRWILPTPPPIGTVPLFRREKEYRWTCGLSRTRAGGPRWETFSTPRAAAASAAASEGLTPASRFARTPSQKGPTMRSQAEDRYA